MRTRWAIRVTIATLLFLGGVLVGSAFPLFRRSPPAGKNDASVSPTDGEQAATDDPAERFVSKIEEALSDNARRERIAKARREIISRFDRFKPDYATSYDEDKNDGLWGKVDGALGRVLDENGDKLAAGHEKEINRRLRFLDHPELPNITIAGFRLRGRQYFAVAYSLTLFETGGYAVNSLRVLGPRGHYLYETLDVCRDADRRELNRRLAEWRSPTPLRILCESLRLSVNGATVQGNEARIGTIWTRPTGRGRLVYWRFDGKRLRLGIPGP